VHEYADDVEGGKVACGNSEVFTYGAMVCGQGYMRVVIGEKFESAHSGWLTHKTIVVACKIGYWNRFWEASASGRVEVKHDIILLRLFFIRERHER